MNVLRTFERLTWVRLSSRLVLDTTWWLNLLSGRVGKANVKETGWPLGILMPSWDLRQNWVAQNWAVCSLLIIEAKIMKCIFLSHKVCGIMLCTISQQSRIRQRVKWPAVSQMELCDKGHAECWPWSPSLTLIVTLLLWWFITSGDEAEPFLLPLVTLPACL